MPEHDHLLLWLGLYCQPRTCLASWRQGDWGMKLGLLLGVFFLATCFLAIWLFANWIEWSMADFVCQKGYWECREPLIWPMALRVGLSILAWGLIGVAVAVRWKKS